MGLLRTQRGLTALDTTIVSPLAVLLFGPPWSADADHTDDSKTIMLEMSGASIEVKRDDLPALAWLRMHMEAAIAHGVHVSGGAELDALRATIEAVLVPGMDVPWAGLPSGWDYAPDEAGKPLYRSREDPSTAVRAKPTVPAVVFAEQQKRDAAARSQLAAAREAKDRETQALAASKGEADISLARESARAEAKKSEHERVAAAQEKADALKTQAAAEAVMLKAATKNLVARADAKAAESRAAKGVSGGLGGVAKLLMELELDKYAAAFESAGYDDARLADIAELIDMDMEEGGDAIAGGEGAAAVEELIATVGVKGGSAVKLRRRLLDPAGGKGGGRGDGRGSKGGGRAKGGGGRGRGASDDGDSRNQNKGVSGMRGGGRGGRKS